MLMMLLFVSRDLGSLERMYGAISLIRRNGAVLWTLSMSSNMSSGVVWSICERRTSGGGEESVVRSLPARQHAPK